MVDTDKAKSTTKEAGLETIAIAAIPAGIAMIQAGQLEAGIATAIIGIVVLGIKYHTRA